jgi:hypothetical protein
LTTAPNHYIAKSTLNTIPSIFAQSTGWTDAGAAK